MTKLKAGKLYKIETFFPVTMWGEFQPHTSEEVAKNPLGKIPTNSVILVVESMRDAYKRPWIKLVYGDMIGYASVVQYMGLKFTMVDETNAE